jgi:hypothetical protein
MTDSSCPWQVVASLPDVFQSTQPHRNWVCARVHVTYHFNMVPVRNISIVTVRYACAYYAAVALCLSSEILFFCKRSLSLFLSFSLSLSLSLPGARVNIVDWGTMYTTSRRAVVFVLDEVMGFLFSNWRAATVALGSTPSLTDISTRNLSEGKGQPAL